MEEKEYTSMEEAYEDAEKEFRKNAPKWKLIQLVYWWSRWYPKAGHKRLGRLLAAYAKENPFEEKEEDTVDSTKEDKKKKKVKK